MMIASFKNYASRKVLMSNNDAIVCYFFRIDGDYASLHDVNHNIFRLTPKGEVVWQVSRDDSIRSPNWWEVLHAHARERGEEGAREPFKDMVLQYRDGSTNCSPQHGNPPDEAAWVPGCTIMLRGSAYQEYILDPETGIAKNITEGHVRPW